MLSESVSTHDSIREAWVQFSAAGSYEEYCQSWLELLSRRIGDVAESALLLKEEDGTLRPAALYPRGRQPAESVTDLLEECAGEESGLVHDLGNGLFGVAFPIRLDGALAGAVALALTVEKNSLPMVMEQIQWGSAWVELLLRRHRGREVNFQLEKLSRSTELLAAVLAEPTFAGSAMMFVNFIARQFNCGRVSLGMKKGGSLEIAALSHSAQFGKKMNLMRKLIGVMEEATLQGDIICFPERDDGKNLLVTREHARFSYAYGNANVLTIPLHSQDDYFAAVTLERPAEMPFTADEIGQVQGMAALSAEALKSKRIQDRNWYQHLWSACVTELRRLIGPAHFGRKLAAFAVLSLMLFFQFATGTYRVSAEAVLEPTVLRSVVTPFDGYIDSASVKAGEAVAAGQEMSRLDDRDLLLERLGYLSESGKLQSQYEQAVAGRDRSDAKVIQAQIQQNAAQLKLAESRLQRTRQLAPFDGVVVSGDLSQRLGSATQQGEVLFEVAPLDSYRVVLLVDEHRMAHVQEGLSGRVVLNALPERSFDFEITQVTPITEAKDGGNYFRVEAALQSPADVLRPGMEGVGKIEVGEANLFWVWTHPFQQWVRLKLWEWLP